MAVNIHITIIELNALHTKRQNLFQELDAVIHLLMEAKHWGLRKSRNATGWLWPVDAKGEPLKATSYMAVGFYVAKYVNKKSDMDLAAKGLGAKEWNNSLKTKLSLLPKKLFRIRMSRNFGMKMLTMTNLSTECLIQLTKLGY